MILLLLFCRSLTVAVAPPATAASGAAVVAGRGRLVRLNGGLCWSARWFALAPLTAPAAAKGAVVREGMANEFGDTLGTQNGFESPTKKKL